MTLDPAAALRLYDEAWTIPDYERRLGLLRKIWADDGLYVDPDVPEGGARPGSARKHHRRTVRAVLGDRAWLRWKATLGTGESFHGVDFVEFAADGRIARLTGFYEA